MTWAHSFPGHGALMYEKRPRTRRYRKTIRANLPFLAMCVLVATSMSIALFFIFTGGKN